MILGISGGSESGNADILVKASLEECKKAGLETKFINISKRKILSCTDCGACRSAPCPLKDDMQGILDSMAGADAMIIGSPTYFANVSSHISLMMERSLPLRRQGFKLRNKVGGAIAVGGSRNGGQESVIRTLQNWFTLHGMIVVGDDAPTAHFGGIGVGRGPGDAAKDDVGLETARNLGKHVAEIVSAMKA
jgi:multimeric flavodoxin WrbA